MLPAMIGEQVGSYRIVAQLGKGGMGVVYLAQHPIINKRAAVKMLQVDFSMDGEAMRRFFNEAQASSRLHHPGVAEVFDFGYHHSGRAFIVMEYLAGESLTDRIARDGVLDEGLLIEIARQLAGVLHAAHSAGIVHRDLKPDNVQLLSAPDLPSGVRAKVLDFGIAKVKAAASAVVGKTESGMMLGTPTYMSPEQCVDSATVDHRADIYALGCVMFEMATGAPPYNAQTLGALVAAHMRDEIPSLAGVVAAPLAATIERALAKAPEDRQPTMEVLLAELDAIAAGQPPRRYTVAETAPAEPEPMPVDAAAVTLLAQTPQSRQSTVAERPAPARVSGRGQATVWRRPASWGVAAAALLAIAALMVLTIAWPARRVTIVQRPVELAPTPETKAAPPPAATPEPPRAPPPALPARVVLTIESRPSGAEVYRAIDGVLLGPTPHREEIVPTRGAAVFVVRRPGFLDAKATLDADRDGRQLVTLRPLPTSPRQAAAPKRPVTTKPAIEGGVLDPFAE